MGDRYDAAYDHRLAPQVPGDAVPTAKMMAAYDMLPKIVRQEIGQALLPYNIFEFLEAFTRGTWGINGGRPMTELQLIEQIWGANKRNHDRLREIIRDWPKQEITPIKAAISPGNITRQARRLNEIMAKRFSRRDRALASSRLSDAERLGHTQAQTPPTASRDCAEPRRA